MKKITKEHICHIYCDYTFCQLALRQEHKGNNFI